MSALADDVSGTVEGTLVDRSDHPVPHAALALDGPHALLQTSSDAKGHFVFFGVLPGRYDLKAVGRYLIGGYCAPVPAIDVDAGITWHLVRQLYVPYPRTFTRICAQGPENLLQQLTSAGTTADLYIIH